MFCLEFSLLSDIFFNKKIDKKVCAEMVQAPFASDLVMGPSG